MSVDTLIGIFKDKPLDFKPGERWSYSNSGFVLLGAVIEKASGKSYEDFVEQEIFAHLGMTHSRYGHQEEVVPGRADGYGKNGAGLERAPYLSLTQPYAAGSLLSNVDDLARWLDALESNTLLSADSRRKMFTPEILHGGVLDGVSTRYGFGYGVATVARHPALEHSGEIFGYVSDVLTLPDDGLQVIILSNNADGSRSHGARAPHRRAGGRSADRGSQADRRHLAKLAEYPAVYRVVESDKARRVISLRAASRVPTHRRRAARAARDRARYLPRRQRQQRGALRARRRRVAASSSTGHGLRSPRTDEAPPAARTTIEVAPELLEPLVGAYSLAPSFEITITREAAQLFAQATGQPRLALLALSPTRFALGDIDAELEFVKAADGTVGLILHQGGQDMPGKRKP